AITADPQILSENSGCKLAVQPGDEIGSDNPLTNFHSGNIVTKRGHTAHTVRHRNTVLRLQRTILLPQREQIAVVQAHRMNFHRNLSSAGNGRIPLHQTQAVQTVLRSYFMRPPANFSSAELAICAASPDWRIRTRLRKKR